MICGIYIIEFKTPVWGWYVGQSQDVESRWKQHKKKAADGTHQIKLQQAFNDVKNPPEFRLLAECHKDWLNILEEEFYAAFKQRDQLTRRDPHWKSLNTKTLQENVYQGRDPSGKFKHNPKDFLSTILSKQIHLGLKELG